MTRRVPIFTPDEIDALLAGFEPYEPPAPPPPPVPERLWTDGKTVKHDYDDGGAHGLRRAAHDYLALEQAGAFGDLPAREQQRVLRQLAFENER